MGGQIMECDNLHMFMCGAMKGSLFWLNEACSGDPVENSTRDRTISYAPRHKCLTPQVLNSIML